MSEGEREPREWRVYVKDMIGFCERVRDYTAGQTLMIYTVILYIYG